MTWHGENQIQSRKFRCGFCGNTVATDTGFSSKNDGTQKLYICPHCDRPTFFDSNNQVPGVAPGMDVSHLPKELEAIYNEARRCVSIGAYTSAVLSCRKLLMHIGVQQKAEPGKPFIHYVEYLAGNGYVPPNGKAWVDHIRKKGNEATHEIVLMSRDDANELILFSEMLLKFIYEFPARVPSQ
jgi:hypothetical protein